MLGVRSGASWDEIRIRLVPGQKPEDFDEAARAFARGLAEGPTRAHAATKAIVRAGLEGGGARGADERGPELAGDLFATEDLQNAVRSFLERGPGHAEYEGR